MQSWTHLGQSEPREAWDISRHLIIIIYIVNVEAPYYYYYHYFEINVEAPEATKLNSLTFLCLCKESSHKLLFKI